MDNTHRFLLLFALISGFADRLLADCPEASRTSIYFSNGIGKTQDQAEASLDKILKPAILSALNGTAADQSCLTFKLAYDSNWLDSNNQLVNNAIQVVQIFDAVAQRGVDFAANFWNYWNFNGLTPPAWWQDLQRALITSAASVFQPDLVVHETKYYNDVALGHNVIVVAHSQGNLYVNQAYIVVTSFGRKNLFNIVAVATPATNVAGFGPYYTLHGDIITIVPGALEPNTDNDAPSPCLAGDPIKCHGFADSYMAGDNTHLAIVNAVIANIPGAGVRGSGTVAATANLDAVPWPASGTGAVDYSIVCPFRSIGGSAVPGATSNVPTGTCTILYNSGGPPNTSFSGIGPCISASSTSCTQNLAAGQILTFTFQFKNNPPTAGFLMASGNLSAMEGQSLNLTVPTGGTASVSFSASRSVTSTGNIVGWNWTLDGIKTSSQFSFTTNLSKGSHSVTLVVTTDSGALSSPATGTIIVAESTVQPVWPVPGHDSQRTGLANYGGPGQIPSGRVPRWSYASGTAIVGDMVVSAEGTLYFASDKLYALTPSGTSYASPVTFDRGVPLSSPAVDDTNGFVYVVVSSPNPTNNPNLRAYDVVRLSKQLTNQTTVYHSPYPYSNPNIVPHGLVIGTDGTVYFTDGATVVARSGHSWAIGIPNTGPCFGNPGFLTPTLGSDGNVFVPCEAYAGNAFGAGLYKFDAATGAQLKYTPYPYMRVEFMFDAQNRLRAGDSSSFGSNSTGHYDAWDTNLAPVSDVPSDDTSSRSSLLPDGASTVRIGKSTLVDPTNTFYYDPNYLSAQTNTLSARGAHSWDIRGGTGGSTSFFSTVPSVDSAGNIFVGTVAEIESRSGIDGSLIWSFATGDTVSTQPVIAGPGVLYVGTSTGKIYAF